MLNKRLEYRLPIDIIVDHVQAVSHPAVTVKGYIRELSASGCRLESAAVLTVAEDVLASFVLMSGHVIVNARVKILRELPGGKKMHLYAGHFVDLPESDQFKIREFIIWKEAQKEKSS
jgi:hypothetical protein